MLDVSAVEKNREEKGEQFWKRVQFINSVVLPEEVTET